MELFQDLVFTISISLIVSLLIAKLFSIASTFDDDSITVEEKIEKEWVVCDPAKEENARCFKDPVNVTNEVGFRYSHSGFDLRSRVAIHDSESDSEVGPVGDCYVFDESPERNEPNEAGADLVKSDKGSLEQEDCVKSSELQELLSAIDAGEVKLEDEDEILDDDWQGVETTELEKSFGAAVAFMDSKTVSDHVNLIDNEVKIELYGLHSVAIQGSCFEPQPMAFKVSARANWNSWKRLENLGREDAMEQYIALLSQHVPDWNGSHCSDRQ